ncbi:MAG: hypothetical protein O2909_11130 [Chloroflexi bacterium]|nr:hypothetical protein [Chloroflexota bacterium]PKB57650.1 MAG: hypothetical protein BZY73_02155 [SAR202 cluster bacterium Casp-Chloro-G3]
MQRDCALRITRVGTTLSFLIVAVLLLAGCVYGTAARPVINEPVITESVNKRSEVAPSINLLTPWAGQTLSADNVEVKVEIDGFTVDAKAMGGAAVAGRGHWHLYLDGEFMLDSAQGRVMLEPLLSGPHHMRVALANNDHYLLNPSIEDSVVFDIMPGEDVAALEAAPEF